MKHESDRREQNTVRERQTGRDRDRESTASGWKASYVKLTRNLIPNTYERLHKRAWKPRQKRLSVQYSGFYWSQHFCIARMPHCHSSRDGRAPQLNAEHQKVSSGQTGSGLARCVAFLVHVRVSPCIAWSCFHLCRLHSIAHSLASCLTNQQFTPHPLVYFLI